MSVKFVGVGGPSQIGNVKNAQKSSADTKTEGVKTDKVEFSSVLQDVNKTQTADATAGAERAAKIAELKAQIADGSYKPDLKQVASSLVNFLQQGKE